MPKKAASKVPPRSAPRSPTKSAALPKSVVFSFAIVVSDRKRSLEWYTKTLGLDAVQQMDHWVTVGRKGAGGLIHLCQTTEIGVSEHPEPGTTGLNLHLPGDFRGACAALEANGVPFTNRPTQESWGWWATVVDPDGNEITLMPED